jgi:hypothetical protein
MRKYKSTKINVQAFRLTLEGVSLNATASRLEMSAGRVRYALHSECKIRCPRLYKSLVKDKVTPSLADLRRFGAAFIDSSDMGEVILPRLRQQRLPIEMVHMSAPPQMSLFSRIIKSVFG